jgi:mannose-6-phosphate isomerase-like protein (cupin superfamily)
MSTEVGVASATLPTPRHVPAAAGRLWWYGGQVAVKLTGADTDGRVGVWFWEAHRGAAAPVHVHRHEEEYFLVVDGQARLFVGDRHIDAGPGDLVALPRGVPHAYLITSETARLVGMASPGGFESFFAELGTPVVEGEPPAAAPDPALMARTAAVHGVEILGPPPTLD